VENRSARMKNKQREHWWLAQVWMPHAKEWAELELVYLKRRKARAAAKKMDESSIAFNGHRAIKLVQG